MRLFFLSCIGFVFATAAAADKVTLIYGDVLEGKVVSEDETTVRFQNEYGERVFQKADIREILRDSVAPAAPVTAAPSDAPIVQETGALPPEWSNAPAAPVAPPPAPAAPSAPVDLPAGSWPSEPAAQPKPPVASFPSPIVSPSSSAPQAQALTPATTLGLPPREPSPGAPAPAPVFGAAPSTGYSTPGVATQTPPAYAPPAPIAPPAPPAPAYAQASTPYDILKLNVQIQSQWRDLEISYIQRAFVNNQAYETQYIGRILPPDYMRAKLITQVPPSQQTPQGGQVEYDMYRARDTLWQVAKVPGQPIQYLQMNASRVEGSAGGGPLDSFQKGFSGAGSDEDLLQTIARNSSVLGSEVIEGIECWVLETRYTPEVIDAQVRRAQPQAQTAVRTQLSQMGVVRNWIGKQDMVQRKMESFTPAGAPLMGLTILSVKPNMGLDAEQLRMKVPKGTVWMDITDMMMRGGTPGVAGAQQQQMQQPQQQMQQPQQFQSLQSSAWQAPAQGQYQASPPPQYQQMPQQPTYQQPPAYQQMPQQQQYSYNQQMQQPQQQQMWQQPGQSPQSYQQNFVQPGYPGMPQQQPQQQQQPGFLSRMFGR